MLKVASYNIRKAIGTDRRRSPERIIDVLNEMDADIVALQEADRRFGKRLAVLPDWLLEAHTPYRAVPLGVRTESMGWHGNALLIRREHDLIAHDHIHLPCLEPRGAVTATLKAGGHVVRVVGMHLDLSGLWRRRQATAVCRYLDAAKHDSQKGDALGGEEPRGDGPDTTILMGDLNEWSAGRGCLVDFMRHYELASCGRSFHATRPVATLDRILWRGTHRLDECGVHLSPAARRASDHLPVWARFSV